jgi:hypothetical protein
VSWEQLLEVKRQQVEECRRRVRSVRWLVPVVFSRDPQYVPARDDDVRVGFG